MATVTEAGTTSSLDAGQTNVLINEYSLISGIPVVAFYSNANPPTPSLKPSINGGGFSWGSVQGRVTQSNDTIAWWVGSGVGDGSDIIVSGGGSETWDKSAIILLDLVGYESLVEESSFNTVWLSTTEITVDFKDNIGKNLGLVAFAAPSPDSAYSITGDTRWTELSRVEESGNWAFEVHYKIDANISSVSGTWPSINHFAMASALSIPRGYSSFIASSLTDSAIVNSGLVG